MPMTLDEYLALPGDTRCKIVDGVPRPMVRPSKLHRQVQRLLANALDVACPDDVAVSDEEVVTFSASPPHARIPDVVVYRADGDPTGRRNHTAAADVLLVVEVVSENTQTADRYENELSGEARDTPGASRARARIVSYSRPQRLPRRCRRDGAVRERRTGDGEHRRAGRVLDERYAGAAVRAGSRR